MTDQFTRRSGRARRGRWWLVILLAATALLLTGCVRYEVGVTVDGQFSGAIAQHVKLGDQLTSFSRREAERWLDTIAQRARRLHGRVREVSDTELRVTIPFHNGQEFVQQFNQFFNPNGQAAVPAPETASDELVELAASAALNQQNFLLLERDRLALDIDLRGLSALDDAGSTLAIDPGTLLDLEFALNTPWGARALARATDEQVAPAAQRQGGQLVWRLQPGRVNHIEAAYWLPSWLGLGTLAIAGLVAAGRYVKYHLLAPRQSPPAPADS